MIRMCLLLPKRERLIGLLAEYFNDRQRSREQTDLLALRFVILGEWREPHSTLVDTLRNRADVHMKHTGQYAHVVTHFPAECPFSSPPPRQQQTPCTNGHYRRLKN